MSGAMPKDDSMKAIGTNDLETALSRLVATFEIFFAALHYRPWFRNRVIPLVVKTNDPVLFAKAYNSYSACNNFDD